MTSGEYTVRNIKNDNGELSADIELHIVTWEGGDKTFEQFEEELRQLLDKYAI